MAPSHYWTIVVISWVELSGIGLGYFNKKFSEYQSIKHVQIFHFSIYCHIFQGPISAIYTSELWDKSLIDLYAGELQIFKIVLNRYYKQRVLMHGHQGWNVRHGLCHIYMIYVYIWVVYSFCLFCCLFIIVTAQFVALYKPCKPKPKFR